MRVLDDTYHLRREISRSEHAVTHEAVHRYTGRAVAAKVGTDSRDDLARHVVLREARVLTAVRHPNVVLALDAGVDADGTPYVVLEYLEGRSVDGLLAARGRFAVAESVKLGRQILDCLAHVHARDIVHGDLRAANVFMTRTEINREAAKLIDFRLARSGGADDTEARVVHERRVALESGTLGQHLFAAPELFRDPHALSMRSDIYAVAVLLFECLTGELPHRGAPDEIRRMHTNGAVPPSARTLRADVPRRLADVIASAMAPNPTERPDAAEFGRALLAAFPVTGPTAMLGSIVPPARASDPLAMTPSLPSIPGPPPAIRFPAPFHRSSPPARQVMEGIESGSVGNAPSRTTASSDSPPEIEGGEMVSIELDAATAATLIAEIESRHAQASAPPPPPTPVEQRRANPRVPYVTLARVMISDGGTLDGRTEDISAGGLLIVGSRGLPLGTTANVRFALPTSGDIVTVACVVRWLREGAGRSATGLEFVDTTPAVQTAIDYYVKMMLPQGTPT